MTARTCSECGGTGELPGRTFGSRLRFQCAACGGLGYRDDAPPDPADVAWHSVTESDFGTLHVAGYQDDAPWAQPLRRALDALHEQWTAVHDEHCDYRADHVDAVTAARDGCTWPIPDVLYEHLADDTFADLLTEPDRPNN